MTQFEEWGPRETLTQFESTQAFYQERLNALRLASELTRQHPRTIPQDPIEGEGNGGSGLDN